MENILLEDDMQEYKKLSYVLLAIGLLAVAAFIANICFNEITQDTMKSIIIAGIVVGFIFCYSVYNALYVARYKVIVTDNSIQVRSLFGNKAIELTNGIVFERKKYNGKYEIFKITFGTNSITVRTKKSDELSRILQQYSM